jgi:hypothetical protein
MRIVPANGAETVHWFNDRLTDVGSHIRCTLRYPRDVTMLEDLNRDLHPIVRSKRAQIEIHVLIVSMADQWFLQEIDEALGDRQGYSVFLSLDGGVVYRQVVRPGGDGMSPQPIRNKTCVGATFTLSLQTKSTIGRLGPMMTDPGIGAELLQNGGFEQWSGAGDAQGWAEVTTGGTVTQETTIVHTVGGSALKLDRTGASSSHWVHQDNIGPLAVGSWYRASGWFASGATGHGRIQIQNLRTTLALKPNGRDWAAVTQSAIDVTATTVFAFGEIYFRVAPNALLSDTYRWYSFGDVNPSVIYHDDLSLFGPVLRPGYATW